MESIITTNVAKQLYAKSAGVSASEVKSTDVPKLFVYLAEKKIKEHESDFRFERPSVYVGTYGKYNYGDLSGLWINLESFDTEEELRAFCKAIHSDEDEPALMVQDYENFPSAYYQEGYNFGLMQKAIEYAKLNDNDREMFNAYLKRADRD